jgi:PIN domain nuclease of toxin-antitoxin system
MATPTTLPAAFVSGNVLTAAQLNDLRGGFRVLQVVSTTKTDTYTMSSATYTTVTGLTATITPTSTTSKILIVGSLSGVGDSGTSRGMARIARDTTGLAVGDAAGSRVSGTVQLPIISAATADIFSQTLTFLDSPASTSALVYGIQIRVNDTPSTIYVNRSKSDGNTTSDARVVSTITVMEISA